MERKEQDTSSEVMRKLEELNRKLARLRESPDHDALTVVRRQSNRETGVARISLDFVDSGDLSVIEQGIRDTIDGLILSRATLCKALASIDKQKLYSQAGASSFMEYLEMERIPLNYKTAKEYAKIGNALIEHAENLDTVDFREEDGLKKLVYLDKALSAHPDEEDVFRKVKESSLREFQKWAKESGENDGDGDRPGDEALPDLYDTVNETGTVHYRIVRKGWTLHMETASGALLPLFRFFPENLRRTGQEAAEYLRQMEGLLASFTEKMEEYLQNMSKE